MLKGIRSEAVSAARACERGFFLPQASSQVLAGESESFPLDQPCGLHSGYGDSRGLEEGLGGHAGMNAVRLRGEERFRQAVLLSFCDPLPDAVLELRGLSVKQWMRLLRWLDFSGLALQFLDRIEELNLEPMLPEPVHARLRQRLVDNTERTKGLFAESIAIQRQFQGRMLRYAVLKGASLWPSSIRKPELRSQFDLDFLVAEEDLPDAREILERRGYRLYESRGTCWEYKINERPGIALKDLYKHTGSWIVELHVDAGSQSGASALERVEWRDFDGVDMPVLPAVDVFLRQGLHAAKHICSQFTRAAFLVEFRRHVLSRANDRRFWDEIRAAAIDDPRARLALSLTTLLIARVMGEFAPEALTSWTASSVTRSTRLWVELYGHRVVLGSYPGSKLYLLLQETMQAVTGPLDRPLWRFLIPLRLPPAPIRAFPNETLSVRLARYRMRASLLLGRLRFCVVEGFRFALERRRWRHHLSRVA
jgi:hypothetical protein